MDATKVAQIRSVPQTVVFDTLETQSLRIFVTVENSREFRREIVAKLSATIYVAKILPFREYRYT